MKLAGVLLLLWFGMHYAYNWFPQETQGAVFNIARSLGGAVLVGLVLLAYPSKAAFIAGAGLIAEDLQVVGCGIWWLIKPWPSTGELCSDAIGFPLGAVGLAMLGAAAWHLRNGNARPAP